MLLLLRPLPIVWKGKRVIPVYCGYAEDVSYDGLTIRWKDIDGPWKHAVILEKTKNIRITGLDAESPCSGSELVKQIDSGNAHVVST